MCNTSVGKEPSNVLIVDDSSSIVELYSVWLEEGYRVQTATTGADALDQVTEETDVVLLDRQMPGMSGREVLAAIRTQGIGCRVAMVSGVEPDVDLIEMEFDEYLVKPIAQDELADMVERLARRATYMETIQELFRVSSKLAVLETHLSASQLAESTEYSALTDRLERIETELDAVTDEFTDQDYVGELANVGIAGD